MNQERKAAIRNFGESEVRGFMSDVDSDIFRREFFGSRGIFDGMGAKKEPARIYEYQQRKLAQLPQFILGDLAELMAAVKDPVDNLRLPYEVCVFILEADGHQVRVEQRSPTALTLYHRTSDFSEGVNTLYGSMTESRSGAKSLLHNKEPLSETEYFNRKTQTGKYHLKDDNALDLLQGNEEHDGRENSFCKEILYADLHEGVVKFTNLDDSGQYRPYDATNPSFQASILRAAFTVIIAVQGLNRGNLVSEEMVDLPVPDKVPAAEAKEGDVFYIRRIDLPVTRKPRVHKGGTHASPREHIRRGHWRTCRNGKRVWIKPRTINKGTQGKAHKTYRIEAKDEDT